MKIPVCFLHIFLSFFCNSFTFSLVIAKFPLFLFIQNYFWTYCVADTIVKYEYIDSIYLCWTVMLRQLYIVIHVYVRFHLWYMHVELCWKCICFRNKIINNKKTCLINSIKHEHSRDALVQQSLRPWHDLLATDFDCDLCNHCNCFYAPNFGKVEGAYCFGLVRPSVLPSVRPCVRSKYIKIQFWNSIYGFLIKK